MLQRRRVLTAEVWSCLVYWISTARNSSRIARYMKSGKSCSKSAQETAVSSGRTGREPARQEKETAREREREKQGYR